MIRNYFKTALRHLRKNKLYAFANIVGLTIGIASCLLIGIYVWHELSYDRFHKNADRITRVTWEYNFGDAKTETASTGTKAGPQFQRMFPEVEAYVRLLKYPRVLKYEEKLFEEKNFLYADSAFFSVFSFPLLKGNPATVLDAPEKMVITESMSKKYFGKSDPIGKTINVGTKNFIVTGIVADAPAESQIQFDFIGSFKTLSASKNEKWNEANYITYLLLNNKSQIEPLQKKIWDYARKVGKEEMGADGSKYMTFHLEPLTKVHLHSKLDGLEPNNSIVYIYILAAVALLILLIAGVNYTNLSTAQSAGRSAEIGMRKVMGAGKKQVFFQFICESLVLTFFAVVLALAVSTLLLPYFNQLSGKELAAGVLFTPWSIAGLLLLAIVVTLAAGAYPSLVLSNSKIIHVLKSGFRFTGSGGLRKSLIVLQFVISIFLIISTIVILQQLSFIRNKELGYNKEQVVVLPVDAKVLEHYDDFKKALAATPGVSAVAGAYESPTHITWSDGVNAGPFDERKRLSVNAIPVDEDFVETLGLKVVAGTDFSYTDVLQFDTSNGGANLRHSYILNESAAKALGWTPEEAIGKTVTKGTEGPVKAVVKDFHFRSFHEAIGPLLIFLDRRIVASLMIRVSDKNMQSTLAALEKTWKQRAPHRPFEYTFLDEEYDALYKTEQRTAGVFTTFSTLAILLACLGLFALTAYMMVQRTKEIGIRKVLGASVSDILALVSGDFLKLVALSILIAIPLSLYAINKWLESFVYKISVEWWVFAVAGAIALLIAFVTISLQATKTALTNPIKNLRTE